MTRVILLIPAFAGTFFLGRSFGQEVQTFCDECQSTYVSAEDVLVIPAGTGHQFTRIDDHIRYVMIRIGPDEVVPLMDEADSREYLRNR